MSPSERKPHESATPDAGSLEGSLEVFDAASTLRHLNDTDNFEVLRHESRSTSADALEPAGVEGMSDRAGAEGRRRDTQKGLTPIEVALSRLSTSRDLVLRQGTQGTPGPRLRACFDPTLPRHDTLGALRTELLLLRESTQKTNIIAVLSAETGEGRSQLAAELAISFAQLGRSTLLLDADLRRPTQHELFSVSGQFGLADALEKRSNPVLHPISQLRQMYLCPAGTVSQNPLNLLSNGRFIRLLSEWSRAYEFIVIDTPPALRYADSLALAAIARQVLYLTRTRRTSMKAAQEVLRRLEATRASVLGAVMQDF